MVIKKQYKTDENGNPISMITFSTEGLKIQKVKPNNTRKFQKKEIYDYAIDSVLTNFEYVETDIPVKHVLDEIMDEIVDNKDE